jgi:hypothetical protein
MAWVNIQQNTDEWLSLRAGKVGGSSIGKIMANYGKPFGDPAKRLAINLAIEQLTGEPILSSFSNGHTDRGHEQEPIARALYEEEYFCDVSNGGFYDNGSIGISPDGLVYDEGIIEIKSVIASVQFDTIKRDKIDPKYKWQCILNLWQSGREWIDYVSFCAEFPEGKRLFVKRLTWQESVNEYRMVHVRLGQFFKLVEDIKRTV